MTSEQNLENADSEHLIAVIDIGSNSVRLVVYKGRSRLPHVLFNERVLCGLGREVGKTGLMDDEAMAQALTTLRRFAELCRDMAVDRIDAVATAAVRDAGNGPAFVREIEDQCGFAVRVLTGEEEARFSGLGVLCGCPYAEGVAGDLGGGSLELARLSGGEVHEHLSLSIGPLSLLGKKSKPKAKHLQRVDEALDGVAWLANHDGAFYMVGGSWRALAKLYMIRENAPLRILQCYRIDTRAMREFASHIAEHGASAAKGYRSVPKRRRRTLRLAAATLVRVLDMANPREVVVSALGLREGILFAGMAPEVRAQDPLMTACKEIADRTGRFPEHADKLMSWIDPLFATESKALGRLRFATCLLSDVSWKAHPDFRAEIAFQEAFLGRFINIEHRERAIVAYALYRCYGGPWRDKSVAGALALMSDDDVRYANILGLALRLGQRLTGGTSKPLEFSHLRLGEKTLALALPAEYRDLASGSVVSRLEALADALGVEARISLN